VTTPSPAERAQQLRERAAIERAEAAELESDRNISPLRAREARQARALARNYEDAAERIEVHGTAVVGLTDQIIRQLADEAEEGYEPEQFRPRGEGPPTSLLAGSFLLVSYVHDR
jgi:alkanesulfonate monooxygenase SsuD/methylene tetrahydromethanopterin reductase-like flavin-dependent oxidoreductase (luciferase family)